MERLGKGHTEMNSTNNQKEKLKCKVEDEETLWRERVIKSVSSQDAKKFLVLWKTLCF